jgi:hypothetical protein
MTFSEFADWVTIVSGAMTIMGIGGLFSWGIFGRDRNELSATVFQIFAYSWKTGLCLLLLVPLYFIWHLLYRELLTIVTKGFLYDDYYWNSLYPIRYSAAYLTTALILFPVYCLCCLSVYRCSISPFVFFYRALRYRTENKGGLDQ